MSSHLDYEINKELGECYLFMGELEKAETYYNKAIESNHKIAAPFLGLATIAIQRNDYDKALIFYKKALSLEAKNDKSLTGIGLVLMEREMYEEAFARFHDALSINSANMVALSCLVRISYILNKVEDVIPFLERGIEADETQNTRITLAGCYISLDRHQEATKILRDVLSVEPDNRGASELLEHIISLAA